MQVFGGSIRIDRCGIPLGSLARHQSSISNARAAGTVLATISGGAGPHRRHSRASSLAVLALIFSTACTVVRPGPFCAPRAAAISAYRTIFLGLSCGSRAGLRVPARGSPRAAAPAGSGGRCLAQRSWPACRPQHWLLAWRPVCRLARVLPSQRAVGPAIACSASSVYAVQLLCPLSACCDSIVPPADLGDGDARPVSRRPLIAAVLALVARPQRSAERPKVVATFQRAV